MKYKRVLIKFSGEALAGEKGFGISGSVLNFLADEIFKIWNKNVQIGVVIGGGNFIRGIDASSIGVDRVKADYMGMLGTVINGLNLEDAFLRRGIDATLVTSFKIEKIGQPYNQNSVVSMLENGKVVIFAGGTGNPFFSTDTAAALRALEIGAEILIKSTKVDGIYSDDPMKNQNATFFPKISYEEVLKRNLKVMDSVAVSLCKEHSLPICVVNIFKKDILYRVMQGKEVGSLVYGGGSYD